MDISNEDVGTMLSPQLRNKLVLIASPCCVCHAVCCAGPSPPGTKPRDGLAVTWAQKCLARATAPHLITRWSEGMCGIALARLTPCPTGQLPGIGCTVVTVLPDHIRKTQALTSSLVTLAVRAITVLLHGAQVVADTL
jgi:hypothetical protein